MFHDIHQTRHEPTPTNRPHLQAHVKRSAFGRENCSTLITHHMAAFKGGPDSTAARHDVFRETDEARASSLYLAPREREVLEWAALGKTAWETGQLLGLTEATVSFYTRRACDRLSVKNKTHAVAVCVSAGLFKV